jgi:hypothetical protein
MRALFGLINLFFQLAIHALGMLIKILKAFEPKTTGNRSRRR